MSEVTQKILRGSVATILSAFLPLLRTTNQEEPLRAVSVSLVTNILVLLLYHLVHSWAEHQKQKGRSAISILLKCSAIAASVTLVVWISRITNVKGLFLPAFVTLFFTLPSFYQALAADKAKQLSPVAK